MLDKEETSMKGGSRTGADKIHTLTHWTHWQIDTKDMEAKEGRGTNQIDWQGQQSQNDMCDLQLAEALHMQHQGREELEKGQCGKKAKVGGRRGLEAGGSGGGVAQGKDQWPGWEVGWDEMKTSAKEKGQA